MGAMRKGARGGWRAAGLVFLLLVACAGDEDTDPGRGDDPDDAPDDDAGDNTDDDVAGDDDTQGGGYGTDVGDLTADFTLPDAFGNPIHLYDYRGRVVLVNSSVVWCPYCRAEAPWLERLFGEYWNVGDGLMVLSALTEDEDKNPADAQDAQAWIVRFGLSFPVLVDPEATIFELYREEEGGVPFNMIVDQEGYIRLKEHGFSLFRETEMIQDLLGVAR